MPSAVPGDISRRHVLIGAAALAALGATSSACGRSPEPPQTELLQPQLDLARRDSEMATAAARTAGPFYAPLLNVVADERKKHAEALSREIARVAGETTTSSNPAPTTTPSAASPPTRDDVIAAVRESASSAGELAAKLSGYRAGLLGSIAASCAASASVSLAVKEPTQ